MRTHVDLFSGIGGFALAAARNGVRTVQFCEIDQRCRDFIARAWPGVPIHDDVRSLGVAYSKPCEHGIHPPKGWGGAEVQRHYGRGVGPIWLLTAGVPCQPASRAGKQRGSADDRWLWPQALRLLRHYHPTWALFENPAGIADVGLSGILAAVEAEGYEVRVHSIPACAVGAPHRRERYWIVAHSGSQGHAERGVQPGVRGGAEPGGQWEAAHLGVQDGMADPNQDGSRGGWGGRDAVPDTNAEGLGNAERAGRERGGDAPGQTAGTLAADSGPSHWGSFVWLPCADGKVRRAPGDSVGLVDGLHRSVLGALGNSIVPQVAEVLIRAMIQAEVPA